MSGASINEALWPEGGWSELIPRSSFFMQLSTKALRVSKERSNHALLPLYVITATGMVLLQVKQAVAALASGCLCSYVVKTEKRRCHAVVQGKPVCLLLKLWAMTP